MNFGMYSDAGNTAIQNLVAMASKAQLSGSTVLALLKALAKEEMYEEATDTVVRERALGALGISLYDTVNTINTNMLAGGLKAKGLL